MDPSQIPPELAPFSVDANELWAQGGVENWLESFGNNAADNVKFHIAGQEFDFAGDAQGVEETKALIKKSIVPGILGSLDTSKPMERQVVNVIGGGPGQWCAVDMVAKGTSKKGKPWFHESVMLVKANSQGKWEEVKVFFDTLHIQKHLNDHKHK